ncbi:uncharacterized protein [Tenebrio molitor]|uniref:uncharacterized protein isoform X3 n=1 Tax=Tenebrio molitor TaxID=7067 RepID=UPI0036247CE0
MLTAYYGILVVLILFKLIFCEKNFYCVAEDDSLGMFIYNDRAHKDSEYIGQKSSYLDNSTEQLNLNNSTWRSVNSVRNKPHLHVVDERWETFPDNHNTPRKNLTSTLNESKLFFISVRITNSSDFSTFKSKQWYHLKVKDSKIYNYNDTNYNDTIINLNVTEFYEEITKQHILKLHDYTYLYTNESKTETIYTNTKNCTLVPEGCFSMHLTMCRGCNITIQLNSNRGTINKKFSGTGEWKKEQFPLENFDTCFNISTTTSKVDYGMLVEETFWAIGDVTYLSSNLSCKKNKRYLRLHIANDTRSYTCETALNEKIKIIPSLADYKNKYRAPSTMSSNNYLYLFTVLPVVLIAFLITYCTIFVIRKRKFKFKSKEILCNKIDNMQEITPLNFVEDQNNYQIIYNDGWKKICRKDYLKYVILAFEPSCTHLDIQFSNIPTGYLKDNKESLKKKNIPKNQDQSILPYDVNRVKLNNKKEHRSTDYINASYVQIDQLHYNLWEIDNDLSLTSRTCKEFMNHLLKIPHHVAPVVVHSKNGAGRCGTIVLCDAVLRALPVTDKIDLYGFTVKLRNVRANMVSDLEQYKLAHLIVRDMVS